MSPEDGLHKNLLQIFTEVLTVSQSADSQLPWKNVFQHFFTHLMQYPRWLFL